MTSSAAGRWLLLATLWSLQYIFMRIAVPVFGTGIVAESRALLGDNLALYQVHSLTVDSPLFDQPDLLAALAELADTGVE